MGVAGTLELDVPEFVALTQDLEDGTALLSVEDANVKQQKEMWGTLQHSPGTEKGDLVLT